jgi:hypothetical protein
VYQTGKRIADATKWSEGDGVLVVQAHGDYRQLQLALKLFAFGYSPEKVLKDLSESDRFFEFRVPKKVWLEQRDLSNNPFVK